MKVVLTGATGLIGRALIPRLVQEGYEVRTLSRPEWDGERDVAPVDACRSCDIVIHLAGENIAARRWSKARKKHLIDSRIKSANHLREGLRQAGAHPKLFITASAVGIYGDRADEVLSEESLPGDDFLSLLCQQWESAADAVAAPKILKLRFGVVLSRQGGFYQKVRKIFKRVGASRLGSGRQWFSWIHIEDLSEAILFCLKHDVENAVNMVAPHPVTNSQLTKEMQLALKTFSAPPVPAFVLRLLYGELSQALLSSQRVSPKKLEQAGFVWKYPTLREALQAITQASS